MSGKWLLYGAYGYTGRLITTEARARGLTPVLSGRREEPLQQLSKLTGFDYLVLDLNDPAALQSALADFDLVLHCAGTFSVTGPPMMAACLASGTHYLDITGEIDVFAHAHSLDVEASAQGLLLVPGVGFDVVPTDCLAAALKENLPDATHLYLAFEGEGGMSPGTAKTSVAGLKKGGRIRRAGELIRVPLGYHHRSVDFGNRRRTVVTIPWGDVFTAYISTGIPNIEVYMSVPERTIKRMRRMRWIQPFLGLAPVQRFLTRRIDLKISGPDEKKRRRTNSYIWGQVRNEAGHTRTGRMLTPNSYTLTMLSALGIVEYLLEAEDPGFGFKTPSMLMGKDYASSLPGVLVTMK